MFQKAGETKRISTNVRIGVQLHYNTLQGEVSHRFFLVLHKYCLHSKNQKHHSSRNRNHFWRNLRSQAGSSQYRQQWRHKISHTSSQEHGQDGVGSSQQNGWYLTTVAPLGKKDHHKYLHHHVVGGLADFTLGGRSGDEGRTFNAVVFDFHGCFDFLLSFL